MDPTTIKEQAAALVNQALELLGQVEKLAASAELAAVQAVSGGAGTDPFLGLFTIFVLACFVGYFVVWSVTPALHSPLMGVTNAISSVIIVGGLLAAGPAGDIDFSMVMGFCAVTLASVNIFGGFIVATQTLGFNPATYILNTMNFLTSADILSSMAKGMAFGFIATLMGCYYGLNSGRGAQGVGAATKVSVQAAAVLILAANFLLTAVFFTA